MIRYLKKVGINERGLESATGGMCESVTEQSMAPFDHKLHSWVHKSAPHPCDVWILFNGIVEMGLFGKF